MTKLDSQTEPRLDEREFNGNSKSQFGISAIFWATFVIALAITYLQRMDEPSLLVEGIGSVGIGLLVGSIFGAITKRLTDTIIWSTLIAAFGFICVATDSHFTLPLRIAWATVGAFAGAVSASVLPNRIPLNVLASGLAAGMVMSIYLFLIVGKATSVQLVDAVAAPIIGVLVAVLIQMLTWVEKHQDISRFFMATLLMITILIGTLSSGGLGS